MSTIEATGKTPIYFFKEECVSCTHLNAAGKVTHKCHYAIPNSKGQVNEDCPAADHYLVIGFNPERVSDAYVKATSAGNNRRIIAIVTALNNQHEDVQAQFWSLVQYKTALSIGAVAFDDTPARAEPDEQPGDSLQDDFAQDNVQHQPQQNLHAGHFEVEVPAAAAQQEQQADPYPGSESAQVDSNEWNEE